METAVRALLASIFAAWLPAGGPLAPRAAVRVEHFVLERGETICGLVEWRRIDDERGTTLERWLRFDAERLTVRQVEELPRSGARRLVWRERVAGEGEDERGFARNLIVEAGRAAGSWTLLDRHGRNSRRTTLMGTAEGAELFPLELVEHFRQTPAANARCQRFDPLAPSFEALEVVATLGTEEPGTRTLRCERADGTLALELEFAGAELRSFRWSEGGPRGRAVDAATFRRLRER